MKTKVFVIGATGLIGQAVANQLNSDGYQVVVLTRSREKAQKIFNSSFEIVEADVMNAESIKHVFHGMDAIYINLPERDLPLAMPNIVASAKAAGVKHIGHTSGCTVREENAWHPMIKGHYEGEQILMNSGVPYTIFGLTMVMDMIPRYANNGKPFIMGKQPHGWSWIYSVDFAKMVSKAFQNPEALNKKFTVFGPDKLTIAQAVDEFNKKFHPDAPAAKPKPYWMVNMIALFIKPLKYVISIFKYFEDHPEEGLPMEAYRILGKPKTGVQEYISLYKRQLA